MTASPKLALPYIATGQAQKETTHNDALNDLDTLLMLRILDRDLTAPPGSPTDGAAYIVATGATGLWAGQDGKIALYYAGWRFKTPQSGWRAFIVDEAIVAEYSGTAWGAPRTLAALGTVAAPGISFATDPNTGFFGDGADGLRMVTNGGERMRISSAGQISLATTSSPLYSSAVSVSPLAYTVPTMHVNYDWRGLYMGSSYDATGWNGTTYLGFNAARIGANVWWFSTDGTSNGGAIVDGTMAGTLRVCARASTGTSTFSTTDSGMLALTRLVVGQASVSVAGDAGSEGLRVLNTTSAVNRVEITGAVTGSGVTVAANGTDTNIDLIVAPKGTGRLRVTLDATNLVTTVGAAGGASALPATPLGYMRININGTIRKIPYYND